jgi:hypothetical protein
MTTVWRLSTANGLLLAGYFIPSWVRAALKILAEPIRGLYDTANIAPAMLVSDEFHLLAQGTLRFAWLLALAKLTVAAFFAVSAALTVKAVITRRDEGREALALALVLGSIMSIASMAIAVRVGEPSALHLHATESLLLLGTAVLMLFEAPEAAVMAEPALAHTAPSAFTGSASLSTQP